MNPSVQSEPFKLSILHGFDFIQENCEQSIENAQLHPRYWRGWLHRVELPVEYGQEVPQHYVCQCGCAHVRR